MNVNSITPVASASAAQIDNLSVSDDSRREVSPSEIVNFESSVTSTKTDQVMQEIIKGITNQMVSLFEHQRQELKEAIENPQ